MPKPDIHLHSLGTKDPLMLRKTIGLFTLGLVALITSSANAAFLDAVTAYTPTGANFGPTQYLGFDFKANSDIVVSQLGAYEASPTSITSGQIVYLYDVTSNSLVTSVALTGTFATGFNFAAVTPVVLNTTDVYSIFTQYASSSAQYGTASSITFSPDITNVPIGGDNTGYGTGTYPANPLLTNGFSNILATSFEYQPAGSLVPEPASLVMSGMGVFGVLGVMVRRRRRNS